MSTSTMRVSASFRLKEDLLQELKEYDIYDDTINVLILEVEGHYKDK